MRYFWGLVLGTTFAIAATVGSLVIWMVYTARQMHIEGQGEIGFDLRSMLTRPSIFWLIAALAFAVGFAVATLKSSSPA
jgi:hypothetical protein